MKSLEIHIRADITGKDFAANYAKELRGRASRCRIQAGWIKRVKDSEAMYARATILDGIADELVSMIFDEKGGDNETAI